MFEKSENGNKKQAFCPEMPASRTLDEVAAAIYDQCELTENGHFVYVGKDADIGHIELGSFQSRQYSKAKLLYAWELHTTPDQVGKLYRKCNRKLCLEPSHYCLESPELDSNGWTIMKRERLRFRLGLAGKIGDDCIDYKGVITPTGYGKMTSEGAGNIGAHIIALRMKLGCPLKTGMQASHLCGRPSCVNPNHLAEETPGQNARRKKTAKVTEEQVREIFALKGCTPLTTTEIAARYKISQGMIRNIFNGTSHRDITKAQPSKKTKFSQAEKLQLIISPEMRQQMRTFIQARTNIVEDHGQVHWIPKRKPNPAGYVPTSFKGYNSFYHTLSVIVKLSLDRYPDENTLIRHACRRRDCCAPDHVSIGTHVDNANDKKRDGTNRNHMTISLETEASIKKDIEAGHGYKDIARRYATTYNVVESLANPKMKKLDHTSVVADPSKSISEADCIDISSTPSDMGNNLVL